MIMVDISARSDSGAHLVNKITLCIMYGFVSNSKVIIQTSV